MRPCRPATRKTIRATIRALAPASVARAAAATLLAALLAALLGAGCATTAPTTSGSRLLLKGDAQGAVDALREEEAARPSDAAIKRNLGIALLESGDAAGAAEKLEEARTLAPGDARTLFFLGRAADAAGDADEALEAYGAYLERSTDGAAVVRARMHELAREQAARDVRQALAREAKLKASSIPENTLAVPDFANVANSDTLAPLSRGLAAVLVTDLSRVASLRVLERERIGVLLDELAMGAGEETGGEAVPTDASAKWQPIATTQGLKERLAALTRPSTREPYFAGVIDGTVDAAFGDAVRAFQSDGGLTADGIAGPRTRSALETALEKAGIARKTDAGSGRAGASRRGRRSAVSEDTAPRLGLLLGARRFAQGSFAPAGGSNVQLEATLIDVPQGTTTAAGPPVTGRLVDVLRLEKDLLHQILGTLGVTLTPAERRRLDTLPTRSFAAFLAYARGLDFEERGQRDAALKAYREALKIDPSFGAAREREEIASVTPSEIGSLDRKQVESAAGGGAGGGGGTGGGGDVAERLLRTGSMVGMGPGPDVDRGGETDPSVTGPTKVGDDAARNGQIFVGGDLPPDKRP